MFVSSVFLLMRTLSALDRNAVRGVPMIVGLQWLALNRTRVAELLR